ncbi:MAG: GTPase, partial [Pseudanabaena sp.]
MPVQDFNKVREDIFNDADKASGENVRIAIVGQPNSGKGSLKNGLVGDKKAHIGMEEGHNPTTSPFRNGCEITDLPGLGTPSYPSALGFYSSFNLSSYDLVILVIETQLRDTDVALYKIIVNSGKPCLIVRNKLDNLWQDNKSRDQLIEETAQEIGRKLQSYQKVIFTSCQNGEGLEELEKAIEDSLPHAKAVRWMLFAKARTEEQLNLK